MKNTFVYPGSFCPPTRGHLRIVERAAELFPEIVVLCSSSDKKNDRWFSEEECARMWASYRLHGNVRVVTFAEFMQEEKGKIVMVRGIRDKDDYEYEGGIMDLNFKRFGIDSYVYLVAEADMSSISSSGARKMAEELQLEELSACVSPLVMTRLLEYVLGIHNLFLVVGKPGSGKSTHLRALAKLDARNVFLEADSWGDSFKPLLRERFATDDLIRLAVERDDEVSAFLKDVWVGTLKTELRKAAPGSNVFVEAAYGLSKAIWRFTGGKVLCFNCGTDEDHLRRVIGRGTPELVPFIERIPGADESRNIAKENHLSICVVDTAFPHDELEDRVVSLNAELWKGEWSWIPS